MYKIRNSIIENIKLEEKANRRFLAFTALFVALLCFVFFLFTHVFFNVLVEGDSMRPTLKSGDVLTVNALKDIERGDIIIIDNHGKLIIKRVIALPYDRIKIKDGYVYVNGERIEEDYVLKQGATDNFTWSQEDCLIKHDEIFYLGDNREDSSDSRIYGTCSFDEVLGVVEQWSLNPNAIQRLFHKVLTFTNSLT